MNNLSRSPRGTGWLLALTLTLGVAACSDSPTGLDPMADRAMEPTSMSASLVAELQSTPDGYIRIGVVPSATEIELGAIGEYTLTNKATDVVLFSGEGTTTVELLSAGGIDTRLWLQTACASETAKDDWLARAAALGYETHTQFVSSVPCYRLLLGTLNQGWSARVAFKEQAIADGLAAADAFWKSITIVDGEPQIRVAFPGGEAVVQAPVVVTPAGELVTIDGAPYRGVAEVWTNASGALAGINELPLEEYLYGVVPRELPPEPYGLAEAQKAQAVAARTYALANMGKRSSDGYDLLPTTGDQVYGGYAAEHPVSTSAVDATAGIVAMFEGDFIVTLYHSTSGGFTANSEDVYTTEVPYLRGVPDAERGRAFEHVPTLEVFMRNANPVNLRAHAEGDFESDWSRYHRWTVSWTAEEMAEILSGTLGMPITEVLAIRVTDRADQGRVRTIEFETDVGTFEAHKDAIRWTLRYPTSTGAIASLRSTLFYIEPMLDRRSKEVIGWMAWGGGWGHGVGMSQTGAVGMAERGRSYEQILAHYYQGVELMLHE
jgi:stage II sporulation protein D